MKLGWYARRLRRMSPGEIVARSVAVARQWWWSQPARRPAPLATLLPGTRRAVFALKRSAAPSGAAAEAVLRAADALLAGKWRIFGLPTSLDAEPDWFLDPLTGITAPRDAYCFSIPFRDEAMIGNIKFVWELSRHQPATLLACAWWLTGRDEYAERAAQHLRSWWRENPFLHGVHWISGIELGLRLLAWSWIRGLLSEWPGCPALFDNNDRFAGQLYHHSRALIAFPSTGSSANNHAIAELAGLATASAAFPWFAESADWAATAQHGLLQQAAQQTYPDGWNREQASGYHLFVMEMLLAAALPALQMGRRSGLLGVMQVMADALAASLDAAGRPPRFGDSDDARGLLVDAPERDIAAALLDATGALAGAAPWWPARSSSVLGSIAETIAGPRPSLRDVPRPELFADCGMTILRRGAGAQEVWLRCDAGPHGFLSIAAHGHADALSVELRRGGVELLADPGTYCYHGEPDWRALFRGTAGHNTLTVAGCDQAVSGGPFLWLTRPRSTLTSAGPEWQARHDGYRRLPATLLITAASR